MFTINLPEMLAILALGTLVEVSQQSSSSAKNAENTTTPEALVGRYVITCGEKEGIKEPKERIEGTVVTFTKDTVIVTDKEKKEIHSASYKLDTTTNPCQITMTSRVEGSAGETAVGLIQKDKDDDNVVKLVYALPTGETPTDFKTKEKQLMFVLKKEAESDKSKSEQ